MTFTPEEKDKDRPDENDPGTKELQPRQQKLRILLLTAGAGVAVTALVLWLVLQGR